MKALSQEQPAKTGESPSTRHFWCVDVRICATIYPSAVKIDAKVVLSGFNRHFASSKKSSYLHALA